jgi:hypothetical protein
MGREWCISVAFSGVHCRRRGFGYMVFLVYREGCGVWLDEMKRLSTLVEIQQRSHREGILRLCHNHKYELINQHHTIFEVRFN